MSFRLNIKVILYMFLIYPFYKPYYFAQLTFMENVNDFLYVIAFIIILTMYLLKGFKKTINKGLLMLFLFQLIIILSTVINGNLEFQFIVLVLITLMFALLLNLVIENADEFIKFLLAFKIIIYFYIVINLILMLIYPNGIPSITFSSEFPNYLFGNTNNVIKYALPGLCFAFLYDVLRYKKIKLNSWILFLLVILTLINSWSVTSMIGLGIFLLIQLNKMGTKQIMFTFLFAFLISLFGTVYLVFFKENSVILMYVFDLFGKDMTLTNRDYLWQKTVQSIEHARIFGYGYLNEEMMRIHTGNNYGSHNYYLDTLIRGGYILLIYLVSVILSISKGLVRMVGNKSTRVLIGALSAYFIMWIAEPFIELEAIMFGIAFVLIMNVDKINIYYNTYNRYVSI